MTCLVYKGSSKVKVKSCRVPVVESVHNPVSDEYRYFFFSERRRGGSIESFIIASTSSLKWSMALSCCSKSTISVFGGKVFGGSKMPVNVNRGSREGGDHDRGAMNGAVRIVLSFLEALWASLVKEDGGGKSGVGFAASFNFAARASSSHSSIGAVRVIVGITNWDMSFIGCVGVGSLEEFLLRCFRNSWPVPTLLP